MLTALDRTPRLPALLATVAQAVLSLGHALAILLHRITNTKTAASVRPSVLGIFARSSALAFINQWRVLGLEIATGDTISLDSAAATASLWILIQYFMLVPTV